MRQDQYIGLTNAAKQFIKYMKNSDKFKKFEEENIILTNNTLCSQPIMGKQYTFFYNDDSVNLKSIYIETIQQIAWSGGPMYFTFLTHKIIKREDKSEIIMGEYYEWITDPMVENEYNIENGTFYI